MLDLVVLFDEYERVLLVNPAVARFEIIKRRIVEGEGYIRIRAELANGGLLEISEFWIETDVGETGRKEYTYHWQDATGQLIRRWDSARHYPDLSTMPHHVHLAVGAVEANPEPPTLQSVLQEIERGEYAP